METRKEYIEKLAAKILEWDARIDDLKIKVEAARGEARLRHMTRLLELRETRERAAVMLSEVREATGTAWTDIKKRVDRLLEDVQRSLKKAA